MTDKEKIRKEVERLQNEFIQEKEKGFGSDVDDACILELQNVLTFIDSLQEEPVSEELEEASKEWLKPQLDKSYANYGETKMMELTHFDGYAMLDAIEFGAKWQKVKTLSEMKKAVIGKKFQFSMENVEALGDDSNSKTIKLKGRVTFRVSNPESIIDALFALLENDN